MKYLKQCLFLLITLTITQFACNFGIQAPNAAPQSQSPDNTLSPTLVPVLSGDPTTIVVQAIQILPTLSYRKKEWFTDSQGNPPDTNQPPSLVAEFTPPNNSHVTFRDVEYITVNGNFYTRQTGGNWQLSVPDAAPQDVAVKVAEMFTQALQSGGITIEAAGSDSVNGAAGQVFTVNGQLDVDGTPFTISGKVWIGNDGRLLKMELSNPANQQVMDISLYEYDPSITITAPIP